MHFLALQISPSHASYELLASAELGVQFSHEQGHGLGPTVEFFTLLCRHMQRRDLRMWFEEDSAKDQSSSLETAPSAAADDPMSGTASSSDSRPTTPDPSGPKSSSGVAAEPQVREEGYACVRLAMPYVLWHAMQYVFAPSGLHPTPLLLTPRWAPVVLPVAQSSAPPPVDSDNNTRPHPGLRVVLTPTMEQAAVLRHFETLGRAVGKVRLWWLLCW